MNPSLQLIKQKTYSKKGITEEATSIDADVTADNIYSFDETVVKTKLQRSLMEAPDGYTIEAEGVEYSITSAEG